MTIITVTTLDTGFADDGFVTLDEAVYASNYDQPYYDSPGEPPAGSGADTIVFDPALSGIIYLGGVLQLFDSVTIDGTAGGIGSITISGGGVHSLFSMSGGDFALDGLILEDSTDAFGGSAVRVSGGGSSLSVTNSIFRNNAAGGTSSYSGGAILAFADLTVANSLFENNSAGGYGGAIYQGDSNLTVVNSTFYGNTGGSGGAIGIGQNVVNASILNTTIAGNHGTAYGGALSIIDGFPGANVVVNNSVIAGNTYGPGNTAGDVSFYAPGAGAVLDPSWASISATNSFFGTQTSLDSESYTINGGGDAGLGLLQDNGGPFKTLAINEGSPLIASGSTAILPADAHDLDGDTDIGEPLPVDARGQARVNGTLDIGAVESDFHLVVTTADDTDPAIGATLEEDRTDGDGLTLREAIHWAGPQERIEFADTLSGQTITLTQGQLELTQSLTINGDIDGDGKADITISGDANENKVRDFVDSRVFNISGPGTEVQLHALRLVGGYAPDAGGAIRTASDTILSLSNSTVSTSTVTNGSGGGIHSQGSLNIVNSTIYANSAAGYGGGVYVGANQSLRMVNTTIALNSAYRGGGIHGGVDASMTIASSTITGNFASGQGGGINTENLGLISISNSVVSANSGDGLRDIDGGPPVTLEITNSLVGSYLQPTASSFIIVSDTPLLGILNDNGGFVRTMLPLDGSPLIGNGATQGIGVDFLDMDADDDLGENAPFDARGAARIVGTNADIGAVERIAITDTNGSDPVIEDSDDTAAGNVLDNDAPNGPEVLGIRSGPHSGGIFVGSAAGATVAGTYGSLVLDANGAWTYTLDDADPDTNALASGDVVTDVFTYEMGESSGVREQAELRIEITGSNDAPTANPQTFGTDEDTPVTFTADQIVGNDTDPDTGASLIVASVTSNATGNAVLNGNGTVTFTPAANFNGVGSFSYKTTDNLAESNSATVTVNIAAVADAPIISSNGAGATASIVVPENVAAVTTVTSTDADNEPNTYAIIGGADRSLFSINATSGALAFVSGRDFEIPSDAGRDNIYNVVVRASDGGGLSDDQAIAVRVSDVNGNTIVGTSTGERIDKTHKIDGKGATVEADHITGGDGNDTILGSAGNDTLLGSDDNDKLKGNSGDDILRGGKGRDSIDGGSGLDVADFSDMSKAVELTLDGSHWSRATLNGKSDDRIRNIENVTGGKGDDKLTGDEKDNILKGQAGDDVLKGKAGDDVLKGRSGNDMLKGSNGNDLLKGDSGRDTLDGGGGNDELFGHSGKDSLHGGSRKDLLDGGSGRDTLDGGSGKDTLIGGRGKDELTGGSAADHFVFNAKLGSSNVDTITDFSHNRDKIDLDDAIFTALGGSLAGKQFYAAAGATSAHDRSDRIIYDTSSGKLYYDEDGNRSAHSPTLFAILDGKPTLDAGDFSIV